MKTLILFSLVSILSLVSFGQETLPVPESLTVKNIPEITSEDLQKLEEMMQMADPYGDRYKLLGLDHQGNLFVTKNRKEILIKPAGKDEFQPVEVEISSGYQQTFFPNRQKTIFTKEEGAEETIHLYIHDFEKDTLYKAYQPQNRISNFLISPDASYALIYEMNQPRVDGILYKLQLDGTEKLEKIADLNGYNQLQQFDKSQENVFLLNSTNSKDGKLLKLNLKTGKQSFVFEEEIHRDYYQERRTAFFDKQKRFRLFDNDSKALYAQTGTTGNAREFAVLWEIDLTTNVKMRLSPDILGDVTQFELTNDEQFVVYATDLGGDKKLHVYDRKSNVSKVIYDKHFIFKGEKTFLLDPENHTVYFVVYNEGVTEVISFDLLSRETKSLLQTKKALIHDQVELEEFLVPVADEKIGAMEGIPGFLYLPKDNLQTKLPVVIYFHGGPSNHDEALPLAYLDEGSAAIRLNYRGSTGYGVSFEQADNGFNRHKQVEDLKYLYDWIKEHPRLDENRIILFGGSWGGYMVMAAMTKFPDLFYAGYSGAGVSDLVSIATNEFFIGWSSNEIGDVNDPKMLAYLKENSPYMHGKNLKRPLMLVHGSADVRVPIENATKMIESIEQNGGSLRYIIGKGGHTTGMSMEEMNYTFTALKMFIDEMIGVYDE